ncbi:MAG: hypothetical protein E3J25_03670, partial [Anaerolineales bacterium]
MSNTQSTLRILEKTNLAREIDAFLIDRRARALSPRTIDYYDEKLTLFRAYLQAQGIRAVESITAPIVRRFMLELSKTHNPGGVHAVYRAVKAFLRWYDVEVEPEGWSNPMAKVRAPKVPQEPLQPVSLPDLRAMLATCKGKSLGDRRANALMLALLDTGLRASELIGLNVADVDMRTGAVMVRHGKGGRFRSVFLGSKARRALASYLRVRADVGEAAPLFARITGGRLSYAGLRDIVRRRASKAAISPAPTLHSFRRAF